MQTAVPAPAADEVAPDRPGWLVTVWIATALYLLVELSFNARLLDVVGGNATPAQIDRIEVWGRLISGFALALFGWPHWIRSACRRHHSILLRIRDVAAWSLLAMVTMYAAQEAFLRWLVDRSNAAELTQARHLLLLRNGLYEGVLDLDGLAISREQLATPEGKAFLAMFPMLGSGLGDLIETRFGPETRARVTRRLVTHAMGDPNDHLDGYRALASGVHEGYLEYGKALADIEREGSRAWSRYVQQLRRRNYTPNSVPRRGHAQVRSRVRRDGVPVPSDWRPGDRSGFIEAATGSSRRSARSEFASRLAEQADAFKGIDPPDSYGEFMRDPDIQRRILSALGYTCIKRFDPDLRTSDAFMSNFYDAEADCQRDTSLAAAGPDAGKDARRALLVPIIALSLSLVGALAHIGKLLFLTTRLAMGRKPPRSGQLYMAVMVAPFALLVLFAWIPFGQITDKALYRTLEGRLPYPLAITMRGTIHGQHIGYPLFDAVRVKALGGFTFGYRDEAETPVD